MKKSKATTPSQFSDAISEAAIKSIAKLRRPDASLETLPKSTSVSLVVTNLSGDVLGMYGGAAPQLPGLLQHYAKLGEGDKNPLVEKLDGTITALGQDIFCVQREFLMLARASFVFLPWNELIALDKNIPSLCRLHVLVSY